LLVSSLFAGLVGALAGALLLALVTGARRLLQRTP